MHLIPFAVVAMTPPLTGFFMRVAGLGKIHKEIEEQKREEGRASDRRRQRALSVGLLGQHQMTRFPADQSAITRDSPTDHRHLHEGISELRMVQHHSQESTAKILVVKFWTRIIWLGIGILTTRITS